MSQGFAKPMPGQPPEAPREHPESIGAKCMLTNETDSCVLGIGSGAARFLLTAEYVTYRYLRCVVNVMLLFSQLSRIIFKRPLVKFFDNLLIFFHDFQLFASFP